MKTINTIFLSLILILSLSLNLVSTIQIKTIDSKISNLSSKSNKKFWLLLPQYCYRYGSDSPLDKLKIEEKNKEFINNDTKAKIHLAYYKKKTDCETECKKSPHYWGCVISNNSYDLAFGIPNKRYVCWLKDKCPESSLHAFPHKDLTINYSSSAGCNYICNTIYLARASCSFHWNFKYYCYYKKEGE